MYQADCFVKLKFSESQLNAIRSLYFKYCANKITTPYIGRGFVFSWEKGINWETGSGLDINHTNIGYSIHECIDDVLWDEFSDLLPYMGGTAVVTKMPPGEAMYPHVDRKWRPEAIYIPITGCTQLCISKIYDLPLPDSSNSTHIKEFPEKFIYDYAIVDQPYLTNTHIWHSVQNFSSIERITFGWNFSLNGNYSFERCKNILSELGYLE